MNSNRVLATVALIILCMAHLADAARYVPKWKKQACEVPASQNEQSHYTCDDNGDVKCLPGEFDWGKARIVGGIVRESLFWIKGWQGDLCDVPMCRKGCDPMHGYCKKPGECRCNLGFYGEKCDRCIPLPGCQHGYCNVSFECICNKGWDGLFCTDRKKTLTIEKMKKFHVLNYCDIFD